MIRQDAVRQEIAANLRIYRQRAGLSIYEVGERVGKSPKTVSAWETGRGQPDADTLLALCSIYNISSIADLYGQDDGEMLSGGETQLLTVYRKLNAAGQTKVSEYATDLSLSPQYAKK